MNNFWKKEVLENEDYENYKNIQIKRCISKINTQEK